MGSGLLSGWDGKWCGGGLKGCDQDGREFGFFLRKEFGRKSGVFTSGTCSILVLLYDLFVWMLFLFFRGGGVGKRRPGLPPHLISLSISCYNFSLFVI